jgi:hypothetical protein
MTRFKALEDQIEAFLTRPIPYDLVDPEDWCQVRADRQGAALAFLLGALESMVIDSTAPPTKRHVVAAITQAIEHGISAEQHELDRIAKRRSNTLAA